MKKLSALVLAICLMLSMGQIAYAENAEKSTELKQAIECVSKLSSDEQIYLCDYIIGVLIGGGSINLESGLMASAIIHGTPLDSLKTSAPNQTEYSFGQGTFIVGQDLKAGTYDITCTSTSDENMSGSMSGFSDFYASQGMDDFASMFGSLGDMYGSIGGMTVKTYKANASYSDQYLTLKSGETARIILEDGGKIEISDGTAELTWIR